MRALAQIALLVGVVGVPLGVVVAVRRFLGTQDQRRRAAAVRAAAWQAAHYLSGNTTHVVVRRSIIGPDGTEEVLDERGVAAVANDDPDFDAGFAEAMATARVRAEVFNAEQT